MDKPTTRLLAAVFSVFTLAGAIGNAVALLKGTKFVVVPGLLSSWGDILLLGLCLILLFRERELVGRLLLVTVGIVTALGLLLSAVPSVQSTLPNAGWWTIRMLLWILAFCLSITLFVDSRERKAGGPR